MHLLHLGRVRSRAPIGAGPPQFVVDRGGAPRLRRHARAQRGRLGSSLGLAPRGGHWRDRLGLLPAQRPQRGRHGLAARAFSGAHPGGSTNRFAADHPHPQRLGRHRGHAQRRGGVRLFGRRAGVQRGVSLLHRNPSRGPCRAGFGLLHFALGHRDLQKCHRIARRRSFGAHGPPAHRDRQPLLGPRTAPGQNQYPGFCSFGGSTDRRGQRGVG